MRKEIKIWHGRLEISKESQYYMINDAKANLFVHADKLELGNHSYEQGWLILKSRDIYIGSLWIHTDTDMRTIEKFLRETK